MLTLGILLQYTHISFSIQPSVYEAEDALNKRWKIVLLVSLIAVCLFVHQGAAQYESIDVKYKYQSSCIRHVLVLILLVQRAALSGVTCWWTPDQEPVSCLHLYQRCQGH